MSDPRPRVTHLPARLVVRGSFLVFFVYLCVKLLAFRAWALGQGAYAERPEAVVGILPVGSFMSFFLWLKSGHFDPVLPAGIVIILGALITSFAFKRGFCGWICPVGSVFHGFAWLGTTLMRRDSFRPPRWLDVALRGLRYALAAAIFYWLASVPVAEGIEFQKLPYYATVDARMLLLFGTPIYLAVFGVAIVAMMLLNNVWCRYLCPLGGLYGALGSASPCTVVRNAETCVDCGKCARVCHAAVPVDRLGSVRHAECDGCQDCVQVCPVPGALEPKAFGRLRIVWWLWPVLVVALWLLVYAVARATGHWETRMPIELFVQYFRVMVP